MSFNTGMALTTMDDAQLNRHSRKATPTAVATGEIVTAALGGRNSHLVREQ